MPVFQVGAKAKVYEIYVLISKEKKKDELDIIYYGCIGFFFPRFPLLFKLESLHSNKFKHIITHTNTPTSKHPEKLKAQDFFQ